MNVRPSITMLGSEMQNIGAVFSALSIGAKIIERNGLVTETRATCAAHALQFSSILPSKRTVLGCNSISLADLC